jgi:protoporphyrinogen oxidase
MASSPTSHTPVLVLGAGLAGLSAALHLRRAGVPFRHVERNAFAGGHAITIEDEGYRFDRTGHLLHLRDPEMRALVMGWVGDDCLEISRSSRVFSHGTYTRYPFQANTFGLPPPVAYECLMGFLEAMAGLDQAPEPRNFEDFCLKHFGKGISKHFMLPYNARLWGVSPRDITAAWCQRFVPMPRLEDVVAGAVGLNDRELGYNSTFLYPRLGIGQLPAAMARELPAVELGRAPVAIDLLARRAHFDDEVISFDRLISTIPLDSLGRLLVAPPRDVAEAFSRLRCTSLYYLDVALDAPPLDGVHWVYVPEERFAFYRVGSYSNISPSLAPRGGGSLYVELADRAPPDPARVAAEVTAQLVEMRAIRDASQVRFARLRHIEHAYVIFDHHYFPSLATIQPFLAAAGATSTGRYGGWNYSSMEDALLFGRDAARAASAPTQAGSGAPAAARPPDRNAPPQPSR